MAGSSRAWRRISPLAPRLPETIAPRAGAGRCNDAPIEAELLTKPDFDEIVEHLDAFWGERDLSALHHPMFFHEFGDSAFVVRDANAGVAAYLLGFVLAERSLAYVHLVAVREDCRRRGLACLLYEQFVLLARGRGCERIKAITNPANAASVAFHRAVGMDVSEVADYAGRGQPRVVLTARIASGRR